MSARARVWGRAMGVWGRAMGVWGRAMGVWLAVGCGGSATDSTDDREVSRMTQTPPPG